MRVIPGLLVTVLAVIGSAIVFGQEADKTKMAQPSYELVLGEERFDPLVNPPDFPGDWDRDPAPGPSLHLIQFFGPTRAAHLDRLKDRGIEIVQYIHPFTYVVWARHLENLDGPEFSFIRWTGPFLPAYRVLPRWRDLDSGLVDSRVIVFLGADRGEIEAVFADFGITVTGKAVVAEKFEILSANIPGDRFSDIASINGVYSVQPMPTDGGDRGEMSCQVNVNNVNGGIPFAGYQTWLAGVNLDGQGVIMANVDSGIDHVHTDLTNRMLPCIGTTCGGAASSYHGTHTAGIMAADGSSGVTSHTYLRGLGVAPGAFLVEQVYSPHYIEPDGMLLLISDSYSNDAILSSNSWGPAGSPRGYDNHTMQVDIGVRDADETEMGNQPFTYVLSIMNGYGGTSSQGTPDEAKNIITVGSTKLQTTFGTPEGDFDALSSNSAHGPCLDGRNIPHIVAPGCRVDSTFPNNSHGLNCGTSMASPQVSGGVGLFVEQYRNAFPTLGDPSPALIKATFLVHARDLAGHPDADGIPMGHPFDSKQGFGRMNLEAVLDGPAPVMYFDDPQLLDDSGDFWITRLEEWNPGQPVKIMLVWTDAHGHGLGGSTPAWNNDLDLEVVYASETYFGNDFGSDGWSIPEGTADPMHNTEAVFIGPTANGVFTVRVNAANINSDGVPGIGDMTDQDFALTCVNCQAYPDFSISVTPEITDICAGQDAIYTVEIGQFWDYTDPVNLEIAGLPTGTNAWFSVNPVVPPDTTTLTITDTDSVGTGIFDLTITGSGSSGVHQATAQIDSLAGPPSPPGLLAPPDGEIDQVLSPTFDWTTTANTSTYRLEISLDPMFSQLTFSDIVTTPPYQLIQNLVPTTLYYWRVSSSNRCGDSASSPTFSFTTAGEIILVDDDDNNPDVRAYYTQALDAGGYGYIVYDTQNSDNEPDLATLSYHSAVIWFTGNGNDAHTGPGAAGEADLTTYLNQGGSLFMSSQDYYAARGYTPLMETMMGIEDPRDPDIGHTTVTGTGSVFSGLGLYSLDYPPPMTNRSDGTSPSAPAELAFAGDQGDAAVNHETNDYRTVFFGFPFEAIDGAPARAEVMATILDWCNVCFFYPSLPNWPQPLRVTDLIQCMED